MIENTTTVMLVGVGGQGIILASKIFTSGLIAAGYDVKSSEVHGMAQRGGSVVTQVRFGKKIYSPLVGIGGVDVLLAMEKLEALRYAHFLKRNGIAIVNNKVVPPLPVITGKASYPQDVEKKLGDLPISVYTIEAEKKARELGNRKIENIILLGSLIKITGLKDGIDWQGIIAANVKDKYQELNLKALEEGGNMI